MRTSRWIFRFSGAANALSSPPGEYGRKAKTQVITAGYALVKWGVEKRNPVDEVTYLNTWGNETNWNLEEPLWNY